MGAGRGPSGSRSRRARCGLDAAPGEPGRSGLRARPLTWGVACDRRADDGAAGWQPRSGAARGSPPRSRRCSPEDESIGLRAYREGLAATDPAARADRLAQAAAACPVAGEPCAWLADAAWRRGEEEAARAWARRARHRLAALGVAWDKRLTYERWLALTERLTDDPGERDPIAAADPVTLSQELSEGERVADGRTRLGPAAAERRFARYMDALADAPGSSSRILYPGLDSGPWFQPQRSRWRSSWNDGSSRSAPRSSRWSRRYSPPRASGSSARGSGT